MLMRKFKTLLFRHGVIDREIEAEQKLAKPDSFRLLRLKRLRLALKDQMRRIAADMDRAEQMRRKAMRGRAPARDSQLQA